MLLPKKVKFRKWQTGRSNPKRGRIDIRGAKISFGSFGLKAMAGGRLRSQQIEAARKAMSHMIGKTGKIWIRIFPDRPYTAKAAEVGMGSGKGDPQGYCVEINPGRVIFEIDGLSDADAHEALRKAGTKLPVKTKIVSRAISLT
ncbi:MAG: 50S ribosomal protein L16 [Candidatus Taylorbacteria bacterium RIFCSPHIGHO2_01_FULL_46_22b]|uniref:Large ribosomal subunit protein uL16 n=1 Tax=Candidatus Taylorbacteria bacterium RIFCSPHIGHO2_01_FULL_46_22b TaxID=1802301 RepID=A0A1G2M2V7_9BACT|nr:MAG: 50S ribosomal protein L16 [Candidatus Taylorbacteria bacterium RIFCSPHIGHO2_01_FULL_46_22b]